MGMACSAGTSTRMPGGGRRSSPCPRHFAASQLQRGHANTIDMELLPATGRNDRGLGVYPTTMLTSFPGTTISLLDLLARQRCRRPARPRAHGFQLWALSIPAVARQRLAPFRLSAPAVRWSRCPESATVKGRPRLVGQRLISQRLPKLLGNVRGLRTQEENKRRQHSEAGLLALSDDW